MKFLKFNKFSGMRMAQLLEALTTDQKVRGLSPWHDQTSTQSVQSGQLSVIPGVGITRGVVTSRGRTRKLLNKHKLLSVLNTTFAC